MPLSPFRQKWLQLFPGFHKNPHPPPLPPSHQGRCSVTWIPQNLQGRLHKYSSELEPKRTLLIICLTCISYQSWYFSFASFPLCLKMWWKACGCLSKWSTVIMKHYCFSHDYVISDLVWDGLNVYCESSRYAWCSKICYTKIMWPLIFAEAIKIEVAFSMH